MFTEPFSQRYEAQNMPENATGCISATVDYDGNFFWTHDSVAYEHPLEEYGLSPEDYEFKDKVKVYIDDMQNVIKVTEEDKGMSFREKEVLIGVIGSILVPCLLLICLYIPIAYRTFGKPWIEFYTEFRR